MKEIPLTQGKFALVDDEDFEWLNQWKWRVKKAKNGRFYVQRGMRENGQSRTLYMHREIMKTPKGLDADHRDRNGLDNRKSNLRNCTRSQNLMNTIKREKNLSGYKGVTWCKEKEKWQAQIFVNNKNIRLGRFKTKEAAAFIYDEAAKKYFGEFARLNEY